ncbi:MAG: hypothetical protein COV84_03985 [Candidatus Portnoybacteria bacterium CG11_big_fil_rev_8_21_14_0_20_40_15]|uniref:DUF11 domain-containing protein n=1 Tax=Candidatus Portnoybacteria bacterium CG11_big_fil_rev_8_21_14_0_20_40_15 TaxID=1974817 RepID=A0A2H0KU39_9BACT|nr:MAG: hypothetical protein COV84_03985 [Candidatus Portnoybacteria bacterium CG11_big_fil_rev_8_21_14_0_20_40_15]
MNIVQQNKKYSLKKAMKMGSGFLILFSLIQMSFVPLVQAANPRFNIFTPYVHTQTNNQDYFLLDVKNDTKGTGFNFPVSADSGDILTFSVYYHNGVNNTVANNTMLKVALPSGTASTQTLTASLWADNAENATAANPLSQSVTVNLSQSAALQLISGSVKWFPNQTSPLTNNPAPFLFGQSGSELFGSGLNIGNIEGCWEFSGFVNFQVRVGSGQGTGDLSISKTVRNITTGQGGYSDSVSASQNNNLEFQIQIQNTGNMTLNNVFVRDVLPSVLSYSGGTTRVNGNFTGDGITSGGINIGSLSVGSIATIIFQATVNTNSTLTVTNTAYARADQVPEENDSATIFTSQGQTGNLNIAKYVRNISTQYQTGLLVGSVSANQGDRVRFSVQISSPNGQVNNVRSWDVLPSGLNFISGSVQLDGSSASDSFVSGGINLGTMFANQTRTIVFDITVGSFIGSQTFTNFAYVTGDNVSQQQASAQVILSQQIPIPAPLKKAVANQTAPNGTDTDNEALPGDTLQYAISYTNTTGQTLNNVQITDVLPSYTVFQDVANNGFYNSSQNQITWNIGTIGINSVISVSYRVKVQTVPYTGFIIGNTALLKAQGISDIISNETRTTVILPTVKGTTIRAVTGANSLVENIVYSLLISIGFSALLYFGLKYSDVLRLLKLRYVILKIKARETF